MFLHATNAESFTLRLKNYCFSVVWDVLPAACKILIKDLERFKEIRVQKEQEAVKASLALANAAAAASSAKTPAPAKEKKAPAPKVRLLHS